MRIAFLRKLILDLLLIFLVKTKRTFVHAAKLLLYIFLSFPYLQWPSDQGPKKNTWLLSLELGRYFVSFFFGNNHAKHRLCLNAHIESVHKGKKQ